MCLLRKKGYCETFETQNFHRDMFIKKKMIVKLFKRKDSNEICLLKKRILVNFLNLKVPTNVFIKNNCYCETFQS